MKERLRAEREAKLEAHEQGVADRLDAHRQEQKDEKTHGKRMAKILKLSRSKELGIGKTFLDSMVNLSAGGSKKLAKIQEGAERARLLLQLATKPIEAYAETSSRYPAPFGPALGVAHAAIVASQILTGLRAVGGGGGGGASTGGELDVPAESEEDSVVSEGGIEDTEPKKQVINLTVNLESRWVLYC